MMSEPTRTMASSAASGVRKNTGPASGEMRLSVRFPYHDCVGLIRPIVSSRMLWITPGRKTLTVRPHHAGDKADGGNDAQHRKWTLSRRGSHEAGSIRAELLHLTA